MQASPDRLPLNRIWSVLSAGNGPCRSRPAYDRRPAKQTGFRLSANAKRGVTRPGAAPRPDPRFQLVDCILNGPHPIVAPITIRCPAVISRISEKLLEQVQTGHGQPWTVVT